MAIVRRMPGNLCRFFVHGGCALQLSQMSGDDEALRCREITRLMNEWDHFLDQTETFQLGEEAATELWCKRLENIPAPGATCGRYRSSSCGKCTGCGGKEEDSAIDCQWAVGTACAWELPRCEGVCRNFIHMENDSNL